MTESTAIRIKTNIQYLNESQLRKYLASEAISIGRGGIKEVSAISGVHRNTISAGVREFRARSDAEPCHEANSTRIRAVDGVKKPITVSQPGIAEALERIIAPETYGNPMSPLRYTTKSIRNLAYSPCSMICCTHLCFYSTFMRGRTISPSSSRIPASLLSGFSWIAS